MQQKSYDIVEIDLSLVNKLIVCDEEIKADVFVEPLLIFCEEVLKKYKIDYDNN